MCYGTMVHWSKYCMLDLHHVPRGSQMFSFGKASGTQCAGCYFGEKYFVHWGTQVTCLLSQLARYINEETLDDLRDFIVKKGYYSGEAVFDAQEQSILEGYLKIRGLKRPDTLVASPPNHWICLIHWRVLASCFAVLSPEDQAQLCAYEAPDYSDIVQEPSAEMPENYQLPFWDSHFHLDLLLKRRRITLESLMHEIPSIKFIRGIANYVFPTSWEQHKEVPPEYDIYSLLSYTQDSFNAMTFKRSTFTKSDSICHIQLV